MEGNLEEWSYGHFFWFDALFLTFAEKRKLEGDQPHYQCMKGSSEFMARIKEYNVRKRSPYMVSF